MADKKRTGNKLTTRICRVSFLHVTELKEQLSGKLKYEVTMLFPKGGPGILEIKAAADKWYAEYFGANTPPPPGFKSPFKDGDIPNDSGKVYDGYAGHVHIKALSSMRPGVVGPDVKPIIEAGLFTSGDYAMVSITPHIYEMPGSCGMGFYLNNIQMVRKGKPLGGGPSDPASDFQAIDAPSDTTGMFDGGTAPAPSTPTVPGATAAADNVPATPPKAGWM